MAVDNSGRVALVTGGATGIGRAVCEALVEAGVGTVIVNYSKSADAAAEVVAALESRGATAVAIQADIADVASVETMVAQVGDQFGRLDYLVNNAGITKLVPFAKLDDATPDLWSALIDTNLLGAFWCSRAASTMLHANAGAIVNIASIAGTRAVGSSLPYGVSKAALLQLTRSLAIALAPGIRVNAVSAGTVRSSWHEKLIGADAFEDKVLAESEVVPLKRLASPDDIAQAVVALLMLDFVTGENLLVDGGKSLLY